ncbi:MAG: hypothetical protein FK731_15215 [Asgard group archaeon]|nr:hypothetical protein [Asgard group archaeon]
MKYYYGVDKVKRFSTYDLIIIALMAALGLGTKQLIRPLVSLITAPLLIPGGAIAGGFYMLWIVLVKRLVPKFSSGFMFGITQALIVMILPYGNHGIFTLVTYSLPGLGVDIIDLFFLKMRNSIFVSILEGSISNIIGTLSVLLVYGMPTEYILFIALLALFTGNIGGILAYYLAKQIAKSVNLDIFEDKKDEKIILNEQTN